MWRKKTNNQAQVAKILAKMSKYDLSDGSYYSDKSDKCKYRICQFFLLILLTINNEL